MSREHFIGFPIKREGRSVFEQIAGVGCECRAEASLLLGIPAPHLGQSFSNFPLEASRSSRAPCPQACEISTSAARQLKISVAVQVCFGKESDDCSQD